MVDDDPPIVAVATMVYADEIAEGMALWYQAADENPEWAALDDELKKASPITMLFGDLPERFVQRDAWAIVQRIRVEGSIVSMILVNEDGDQFGHVVPTMMPVKVRDGGF